MGIPVVDAAEQQVMEGDRMPGLPQDAFGIQPDWLEHYLHGKTSGSGGLLPDFSIARVEEERTSTSVSDWHTFAPVDSAGSSSSRRPPFDVEIWRQGKHWRTLGLICSGGSDGGLRQNLVVEDIWHPSLISEWNAAHDGEAQIRVGDVITAVNGAEGTGKELFAAIQAVGEGLAIRLRVE